MGIAKILATQEYAHLYHMWKSIAADELIWVCFKAHFQEEYLDREDLEQISGAAGYSSSQNVKHGEMEDFFMHFASMTEAWGASFIKLAATNRDIFTQLRQQ